MSDWIALAEAAERLAAALFTTKGVTPTARRAETAQHINYAHTMIERQWRCGILSLQGRIETRLEDGSTAVALNAEMDPRKFEDAYFWERDAMGERGFDSERGFYTRINATEICVNRADFEEWLKHRVATLTPWPGAEKPIEKEEVEKAPPSVERVVKYLVDVADGSQTQPELKRMAEEHFGCPLPDHARWRPAWGQLPESQKRPRGARNFKSGS